MALHLSSLEGPLKADCTGLWIAGRATAATGADCCCLLGCCRPLACWSTSESVVGRADQLRENQEENDRDGSWIALWSSPFCQNSSFNCLNHSLQSSCRATIPSLWAFPVGTYSKITCPVCPLLSRCLMRTLPQNKLATQIQGSILEGSILLVHSLFKKMKTHRAGRVAGW